MPQLEKARMQQGDLAQPKINNYKKERKTAVNFQTWGKIWASKFKKLISHPKISIQNNLLQDSQSKLLKCKEKERILKV